MENLGKKFGESVDPVEDPPPPAVPAQDQSTSESLIDSSGQQQPRPPQPLSPLTGCYLLIVVGEPHSDRHKEVILQKIAKAFLSWDVNQCHVSLEKELQVLVAQSPEGEEARFGERLIQYATENLVTEILIHPQLNTLHQCMKNLLSSFTKHRHIVHAGYTFAGNGSWILQDGTLSVSDLIEALHEPEVIRVLKAYGNSVSIDVHCAAEGEWTTERFQKEAASKLCTIRINPGDVMTAGNPAISAFVDYLAPFLVPANIQQLLQPTDVVGNIRFTHPTLYVFPGGQGDAALFGINGFNMLIDGGFARKACFWDFARHLDRLDAVLLTRLNNSTVNGISAVLQRKKMNHVYPQIGHFFCNLQDRKIALSPDGDKDKDSLIVNLAEEGQEIVANLRHLALKPHPCYRDGNQVDPVNLYHKVGHGKLDMYVISPARDSQAVKEFLLKWSTNDSQLFSSTGKKAGSKAFEFPLQNLVSICALLVWQPANPNDTITRILFPGSTPQHKIFEGLEKLKHLEFLKHPVCTARSISPSSSSVSMTRSASRGRQPKLAENKVKEARPVARAQPPIQTQPKPVKPKMEKTPPKEVKEIPSKVSEETKEVAQPSDELPKRVDNRELNKDEQTEDKDEMPKAEQTETDETKKKVVHKSKYDMKNVKPKVDSRAPSRSVDRKKPFERKPGGGWPSPPGTPKKAPLNGTASKAEKAKAGTSRPTARAGAVASSSSAPSPAVTPGKSAKEANNRKVLEARASAAKSSPKTAPMAQKKDGTPPTSAPQPFPQPPPAPVHRRQVRRPKAQQSPVSTARPAGRVSKTQDIDPDVVRTYDPSIDVELGLGVATLKTDMLRQVTRGLDANREAEEGAAMGGMDAAQAEEEEAKVKRDEEETEDVETDEPEEYLIITRQVVSYPQAQENVRGAFVVRETCEIEHDDLGKLDREEIECEKEEDVFLPDPEPGQEPEQAKEDVKDKTADEGRAEDKTPEAGEPDAQKLMDIDEGVDLKEPVSKDHKEGESLPEEKISNTIETSATTAPTLPEDERIEEPMIDEAKLQQDETKEVIEEKYTQEETKEDKQQKKMEEDELKQPPTLPEIDAEDGIVTPQTTQMKRHPRDVVKTPDEVADLPMHEEVDPRMYSSGDFTKEMQKKTEDDKTPTEKQPDFTSLIKEDEDKLAEEDEGSAKDVEKAEEPIKEEKDGHGDWITSQYLNIIDKLEKSASESKKDVLEDIQPEEEKDEIIKESETVKGEAEKIIEEVPEVVSKPEESQIPEEDKLQPQDEVKDDEKRSPSPAKETEIMPKQAEEDVSGFLDSKTSLQPDLSEKSTPQEPEVVSGKSTPIILEKETSGKATPLDLEKEPSGKATPTDLAKDISGKSTPLDGRKDTSQATSGKTTPLDLETAERRHSQVIEKEFSGKSTPLDSVSGKTTPQDVTGKSTPLDMVKDLSGKATPADLSKDISGKSTPLDLEKEPSGKATPADLAKDVSGKSTPLDGRKDTSQATSGKSTPLDLETADRRHSQIMEKEFSGKSTPLDSVSGKSTPLDMVKDLSGKATPLEMERPSSKESSREEKLSVKSDQGTDKDDSDRSEPHAADQMTATPQDSSKDVSGKSTPQRLEHEPSPRTTPHDLEIKPTATPVLDDTSRGPTPQGVISGKATPIDADKIDGIISLDVKRMSITQDVDSSGKITPSDIASGKSSRRESAVDDDDRRSSIQSLVSDKPIDAPIGFASGKSSPLAVEVPKVSDEQHTKEELSRKESSEKDIDEKVQKETPEEREAPTDTVSSRKASIQDLSGKVTPIDVPGSEAVLKSETYDSHTQEKDAVGKKMPMVESSVSESVSSGPLEKDVSGKSSPFSTDKETSGLGGKVTSDSFSVALAEKGTSETYSLEKEGDRSSSPSPVDISPLSLDEVRGTPKDKKSGETTEKDVAAEPELAEAKKEEDKSPKEPKMTFPKGKPSFVERLKHDEGGSSGTSSPDRSLPEKSEGSLANGTESEEECEKGILESEKQEKESQILDISSGEEEELKALEVDDEDMDSETETRKKAEDVEEGAELEEAEKYVAAVEKEEMEKSEKSERQAEGPEVGEMTKVKRMLVTASSEDGGTETEICIQQTSKFIEKEIEAQGAEKAEEVEDDESEGGDFSNLIQQAKMEYDSQRSRKSSYNSFTEVAEDADKVTGKEMENGDEKDEDEKEEEEEEEVEEELGTLLMQARQELAFVRSKSRESQLSQPEATKLMKSTTTTTTTSESTRIDEDNDIITITTILTEEREEQEDGSVKVTTTKETTTTGGKEEGTVVSVSTEFESKKTEEEKSQVNSATSESGMDKQRSGKGDGEGKTSQEEVMTETSRRTSASSIISQEDLVSRKDSAKIEDFRQSSTEMSPLKTAHITSQGDPESLMTSSFYGNLPTEDEMIGKSEHHVREFRRGKGYESVTEIGPDGERTERTYFYGTEEDPTKLGRDRSRYVKAYYTEEEHQRAGEHSRVGVKYHPSDIPEEEVTTDRKRFVQHYYEEEEPEVETETKLRFVQTFSGGEATAEHVDFAKAIDEHISARGEYLGKEIKHDTARYTNGKRETEPVDEDEEEEEEMDKKKDVIQEWGKPLGLPLPPRNKTYTFPRQNISTTSSLSTPSDNSDSVSTWGQPMSLPSPAPPSIQNGIVETLPTKPKEPSEMKKKVHMKKNISSDNKSSGNNTPNRRSESPIKQTERRTPSTGRSGKTGSPYLYLDLTYVPHHGNSYYSNVEFFKKIRARYYVFSGTEPSKEVYNALLEAKQTWEDKKLEVTIIPTYDTDVLGYWVAENEEVLAKNKIDLSPSASRCTINLQDHETSCSAYRLEF